MESGMGWGGLLRPAEAGLAMTPFWMDSGMGWELLRPANAGLAMTLLSGWILVWDGNCFGLLKQASQ